MIMKFSNWRGKSMLTDNKISPFLLGFPQYTDKGETNANQDQFRIFKKNTVI